MKKVVLFLINGFGIEQKDSFSVYKSELVPNLDKMTREEMFNSLETSDYNFIDGFRTFSIESKESLTYNLLDKFSFKLNENPNFNEYLNQINEEEKIHVFCTLNNSKTIEHLKNILYIMKKNIILHIILDSEDTKDYLNIEKLITKITFDIKSIKIGSIVGRNNLNNQDYVKMLGNGVGEKWTEYSKKLTSLENLKIPPIDAKGFYINEEFVIKTNNPILFINYDEFDVTTFTTLLGNIYKGKIYSMFSLKGINYPLFSYPTANKSLVEDLKSIEAKAVIIGDNINQVNYFANGLNNVNDQHLLFMKSDYLFDKSTLPTVIKDERFNLVILNYSIENCTTLEELNNALKNIDDMIPVVKDLCVSNKYYFVLSSLFGIKKEILVDQYIKKIVNFSSKVPIFVVEENIKKDKYTIGSSDVIGLKKTCLKLMNPNYKGSGLIHGKSFLSKLLKK